MGVFQKFRDMGIRWKLIFVCILLVTVPVVILSFMSYNTAQVEIYAQAEQSLSEQARMAYDEVVGVYNIAIDKVKSDLNAARAIALEGFASKRKVEIDYGDVRSIVATNQITLEQTTVQIPTFKIDGSALLNDHTMVDNVKKSVGGTATIFQVIPQGILRVSTNVMKLDGTRAVGTYIPTDSPVYQAVIKGETYYGRAFVVNAWYLTAYEPIKDSNNDIIGVLYVGVKEDDFQEELNNRLSNIVIGETGYIYILSTAEDSKGYYVLSKDRLRDGEDIWESRDASGNLFIQEIVNKGAQLKEGETDCTYYPWQNEGESTARMKVGCYTFFPDWQWVIAPSGYQSEFTGALEAIYNTTLQVAIVAIIIGIIIAYFFANMISNPLKKLAAVVKKVSEGDLRVSLPASHSGDEIGSLQNSFIAMIDNLKDMIRSIKDGSRSITTTSQALSSSSQQSATGTQQVAKTVEQMARGAETQSKLVSEVKETLNSMKEAISQVAQNAEKAVSASKRTNETADKGNEAAKKAVESLDRIKSGMSKSSDTVKVLGEKSEKIGEIVDVITDIAEQTNLLALNAAIEAARAGEAGRGFAVVATEVRKLAEQSAGAADEISTLIRDVQGSTGKAVETMDSGTKEIVDGSDIINSALKALADITQLANETDAQIQEISAATEQQSAGVQQILASTEQVASSAQENAAGAEEVSASAEEQSATAEEIASSAQELSGLAEKLDGIVARFKLEDSEKTVVDTKVPSSPAAPKEKEQKPDKEEKHHKDKPEKGKHDKKDD